MKNSPTYNAKSYLKRKSPKTEFVSPKNLTKNEDGFFESTKLEDYSKI